MSLPVWAPPTLPADPSTETTAVLVAMCEQVAANVERCTDVDLASDVLAKVLGIERYLARKQQAGPARVAARRLELRIGELLGPAEMGVNQHTEPLVATKALSARERHDFRKMAAHKALVLEQLATSRRQVLRAIEQQRHLAARPVDPTAYADIDMGDVPDDSFSTIVADPPWRYDNRGTRNAASKQYDTMTVEDIAALPVAKKAAGDAHLYLWTTHSFLRDAFDIVDAWGFTYKTHLAWVKPQIGMGNYFRSAHEHVLFGVRGVLALKLHSQRSWFQSDKLRHSVKPDAFYDIVEQCSPGPYLEMFARRRRLGDWSVWGAEA